MTIIYLLSILPVISKIFERFVTKQQSLHFQVIISKVQNQHGTPFIQLYDDVDKERHVSDFGAICSRFSHDSATFIIPLLQWNQYLKLHCMKIAQMWCFYQSVFFPCKSLYSVGVTNQENLRSLTYFKECLTLCDLICLI